MFNQCFSQIMPSERFYLGGSYSLRAYEADLAPPVNTLMGCDGLPCLVPIGGRSVVNGTAELRYGLFDNFGVVLFTDCGVLAQNDIKAICMDSFLGATGFGLRYATPVGPIRFDIGWKWCSLKEERRSYAWFLTLGQAF
jgi:outer membrane translocation and assembly module TamA